MQLGYIFRYQHIHPDQMAFQYIQSETKRGQ